MAILLLKIAAPLQSWGINSKFNIRRTNDFPTKSAIVGMIASAMGRSRNDSLIDLTRGLRFGVRADQQGELLIDFHTVSADDPYTTYRHYLSDAIFLVGLEGEKDLIYNIERALKTPYYPLFFGRRSCPPAGNMLIGVIEEESLEKLLSEHESLAKNSRIHQGDKVAIFIEPLEGEIPHYFLKDNPISFSQNHRQFECRGVKEIYIDRSNGVVQENEVKETYQSTHDPLEPFGG